ncbi:NADH-quinone oxidoreductase subunit A, partial [Chloroflexota bacterium]
MFESYYAIGILILITTGLALFVGLISRILGPFRPNDRKLMPYESGMDPIGPAVRRMPVKFYLV